MLETFLHMNQKEFGDLVGVSQPTVSNLVSRGILKGNTPREWIREYCEHLREMAAGRAASGSDGDLDLVRERARLAREQADAQAMKNAVERRSLIRVEEIEPRLESAFIAAREKWLDAVSRLARELPADIEGREVMLHAEFAAFLNRLADWAKAGENEDDE
jgi:phage terminase Nu1 subunit (DNA packaging protein)